MSRRLAVTLAFFLVAGQAAAEAPQQCPVDHELVESAFPLAQATKAVAANKLDILVLGAGSSSLPGPNGARDAYPARLQKVLAAALPAVQVKVIPNVMARRTAADMLKALGPQLASLKPALVIWQTGIVDAMQSIDPDVFSQALNRGIALSRAAGADVVLINAQYSPRTESIIALGTYAEIMRWVAVQHEVALFDRFAIMRAWADQGVFDYTTTTKKLDMAEHVHDCIGRLLAELILAAVKPGASPQRTGQ